MATVGVGSDRVASNSTPEFKTDDKGRFSFAAKPGELAVVTDPADAHALLRLLRLLYDVGRSDVPLGRIFEGHVDALQIISRYGSAEQKQRAEAAARDGGAFGVWNADQSGEPLAYDQAFLTGAKAFASGGAAVTGENTAVVHREMTSGFHEGVGRIGGVSATVTGPPGQDGHKEVELFRDLTLAAKGGIAVATSEPASGSDRQ